MTKEKCPKCESSKIKEVISGGMVQEVHWDGRYVLEEKTIYEKNLNHSTFYCDNKDCSAYGTEI